MDQYQTTSAGIQSTHSWAGSLVRAIGCYARRVSHTWASVKEKIVSSTAHCYHVFKEDYSIVIVRFTEGPSLSSMLLTSGGLIGR